MTDHLHPEPDPLVIDQVRVWLAAAARLVVTTGAGISAESGIPTFRGPGGLWRRFRAEDLATPEAFRRDPRLVWEWYDWRRGLIAQAAPNAGHLALVEMEQGRDSFQLITQNVDGLHQRAGSQRVIEVHGNIWRVRCIDCGTESLNLETPLPQLPPRCPCGGMLRPGVVWFGEDLPRTALETAWSAAEQGDLMLVVGTSSLVYPAAALPDIARRHGARIVEINPDPTPLSDRADLSLRGSAAQILPRLLSP